MADVDSVKTVLMHQKLGLTLGVFVALLVLMVALAVAVYKPRSHHTTPTNTASSDSASPSSTFPFCVLCSSPPRRESLAD